MAISFPEDKPVTVNRVLLVRCLSMVMAQIKTGSPDGEALLKLYDDLSEVLYGARKGID